MAACHSLYRSVTAADFSVAYANQTERDHEELMKAVRSGEQEVFVEEL